MDTLVLGSYLYGLSYNTVMIIIFFREIEKLLNFARSFGPQERNHRSITRFRNIILSFFYTDQVQNAQIGIHNANPNTFVFSSPALDLLTGMTLAQELADSHGSGHPTS